jgi:small redox-active disulfide protein 2
MNGGKMKIQILGAGCPKCKVLTELAQKAVNEAGIDAEVVKVQDIQEIMNYGVMITPALVIDGVVKCAGKLPAKDEIIKWIKG